MATKKKTKKPATHKMPDGSTMKGATHPKKKMPPKGMPPPGMPAPGMGIGQPNIQPEVMMELMRRMGMR